MNPRNPLEELGCKVTLVGGFDLSNFLTNGTPAQVAAGVHACFETFGAGGGCICSASDHLFRAPVKKLRAMAEAGCDCRY
jgi:hypothetical protein